MDLTTVTSLKLDIAILIGVKHTIQVSKQRLAASRPNAELVDGCSDYLRLPSSAASALLLWLMMACKSTSQQKFARHESTGERPHV